MEPIAIVTLFLAALYIVGRGPLVFAPVATVEVYRRMFATTGRTRVFGAFRFSSRCRWSSPHDRPAPNTAASRS